MMAWVEGQSDETIENEKVKINESEKA